MKRLNLIWIIVLLIIPIVYSGGTGDLGGGKEKVTYSFDSKKSCIGTKCTLTIGGQEYADENGTLLENAKSLKDCQFCNNIKLDIKEDKNNFPVRVTDYNYSKMKICFSAGLTQTGKDIPLEIYNKYNTSQKALTTTLKLATIFNENCQDLDFGFDKEMKWGDASTIITINTTNNGILADIYGLTDPSLNDFFQVKFNLSKIPTGSTILNATLCSNYTNKNSGSATDTDTNISRVNSYNWSESSSSNIIANQTTDNSITTLVWNQLVLKKISCLNVTKQIKADVDESKLNSTIRVNDLDYPIINKYFAIVDDSNLGFGSVGGGLEISFNDREGTGSTRGKPSLIALYDYTSPIVPHETNCSYNRTGNKMFRCNCVINNSINFLNKNVTINGSGRFVIRSNFTNWKNFWIGMKSTDKCNISIENGGSLL